MKHVALSLLLAVGGQPDQQSGILLTIDRLGPAAYEQMEYKVCPVIDKGLKQEGCWIQEPEILVCDGSPVTRQRLESAMNYWERLGYSFGAVNEARRDNYACATGNVPFGTIMIDIPSQSFQFGVHIGSTRTWRDNQPIPSGVIPHCTGVPTIFKSKIEIVPSWGRSARILEHELGHALGWNDINEVGHMMNGAWSSGGYSSRGLRNATN